MTKPWRSGSLIFLISAAITCAFIINLCAAVYGCGCRSWWAGAAEHCNIHTPWIKHCPWCSMGTGGFAMVLAAILALQLLLSYRPKGWPPSARFLLAVLAFPAIGTLAALVAGWLTGYWTT